MTAKSAALVPTERGNQREWVARPGVGYDFLIPDIGTYFTLTRVRRESNETFGLLSLRVKFRGALTVTSDGLVSAADFNCSSLTARKRHAEHLRERTRADHIDWFGLLEEMCLRVLAVEDEGEPEMHLHDVQISAEDDAELTAYFFPLLRRHPTIWFGDGGSAKSYLALMAGVDLAQQGHRVLYCDWEFSAEDHRRRLERIVGPRPQVMNLMYRRCDRPFAKDITRLREIVQRRKITYLICDSLGFAADGTPESAEAATNYYRALRELGPLGSLHLAHISKAEQGDQKPFGSVFWSNGARSIWNLKRTEADEKEELSVGFFHRKSNIGRLRGSFGAKLEFIGTETRVCPTDVRDRQEFSSNLKNWERMEGLLKNGPMHTSDIAEALGIKDTSVRDVLSRNKFKFQRLMDSRIALVETPE